MRYGRTLKDDKLIREASTPDDLAHARAIMSQEQVSFGMDEKRARGIAESWERETHDEIGGSV